MKKARVFKRIDKEFLLPWQVEAYGLSIGIRFENQADAVWFANHCMKTGEMFLPERQVFYHSNGDLCYGCQICFADLLMDELGDE